MLKYVFFSLLYLLVLDTKAQNSSGAVPFLTISPDVRGVGMGNTGVAHAADAYSIYRNVAKTVFSKKSGEVAYSFTPCLRELVSGCHLQSVAGYYRIGGKQSFLAGFRSLRSASIDLFDENGNGAGKFTLKDLSVDIGYSLALRGNLAIGIAGHYIRSDMSAFSPDAVANVVAFDLGVYFQRPLCIDFPGSTWSLGFQLSNIGTKVDYGSGEYDLPGKMTLGGAVHWELAERHQFEGSLDFGYCLLPTESKFFDGAIGAEYTYDELLSFRAGYHHGEKGKGENRYATLGCGVEYYYFQGNFAYLVTESNSALKNTWQVSVGVNLNILKK